MTKEYEDLKEALRKPPTPETMKEAAEAFRRYQQAKGAKRSRPVLVSLGLGKTYPSAIPLEQIPDQLRTNPEFFDLMKRIVTKEKQ